MGNTKVHRADEPLNLRFTQFKVVADQMHLFASPSIKKNPARQHRRGYKLYSTL